MTLQLNITTIKIRQHKPRIISLQMVKHRGELIKKKRITIYRVVCVVPFQYCWPPVHTIHYKQCLNKTLQTVSKLSSAGNTVIRDPALLPCIKDRSSVSVASETNSVSREAFKNHVPRMNDNRVTLIMFKSVHCKSAIRRQIAWSHGRSHRVFSPRKNSALPWHAGHESFRSGKQMRSFLDISSRDREWSKSSFVSE